MLPNNEEFVMTPGQKKRGSLIPSPAMPGKFSRSRRLALLALAVGLLFLHGCGGGNAFHGRRRFPSARPHWSANSSVRQNPLLPLANAQITVLATPAQSAAQTLTTTTDANGMFPHRQHSDRRHQWPDYGHRTAARQRFSGTANLVPCRKPAFRQPCHGPAPRRLSFRAGNVAEKSFLPVPASRPGKVCNSRRVS